jgi:hypothetical protein
MGEGFREGKERTAKRGLWAIYSQPWRGGEARVQAERQTAGRSPMREEESGQRKKMTSGTHLSARERERGESCTGSVPSDVGPWA